MHVYVCAVGAILLGLHLLQEFQGVNLDYLHYLIYSASGTLSLLIAIAAFINIYTINYSKSELIDVWACVMII